METKKTAREAVAELLESAKRLEANGWVDLAKQQRRIAARISRKAEIATPRG